MLGFHGRIGTGRVRQRDDLGRRQRAQVARLGDHALPQRQHGGGFLGAVVVSAPQRRGAVELLEYREDHPRHIVYRAGIAAPVIGQLQRVAGFQATQEAAEHAITAVVENPAGAQDDMARTQGAHHLLHLQQGLAQRTQRLRLVRLAIGGYPRAIEHTVAGRLQQDDAVILAKLGQALDGFLLGGQPSLVHLAVLEPVVIEGQIDHDIRTGVVEQLGQAGGIPGSIRWTRGEKADVLLGTLGNQRLPQCAAATEQHQTHAHGIDSLYEE